jgi:hypothetical protein
MRRDAQPSAAIIDFSSVKRTEKGAPQLRRGDNEKWEKHVILTKVGMADLTPTMLLADTGFAELSPFCVCDLSPMGPKRGHPKIVASLARLCSLRPLNLSPGIRVLLHWFPLSPIPRRDASTPQVALFVCEESLCISEFWRESWP